MPLSWYVAQARESCEQAALPNGVMARGLRLRAIEDGSRVVVNGCGGDEWLAGSRSYYAEELVAGRFRNFAACIAGDVRSLGPAATAHAILRHGLFALLPTRVREALRVATRHALRRVTVENWLVPKLRARVAERRLSSRSGLPDGTAVGQRDLLQLLYHEGFRDWSREAEERFNSELGLEARRPMDTPAMIQFAISTPARLRLRGNTTKFTHINALRGLVPTEIFQRRTKAVFSSVMRQSLDQLENWFGAVAATRFPQYLDEQSLVKLFKLYKAHPKSGWPMWVLWSVYGCLEPLSTDHPNLYTGKLQQNETTPHLRLVN
jgi:asparagine synthase (glutamine-hydrolysing)